MSDLLPLLSAAAASLSAVLVWGFATGRWVQKREADHWTVDAVRKDVSRIKQGLRDEDSARRALVEKVNADFGRLESRVVWHNERDDMMFKRAEELHVFLMQRIERLEEDVRDLQRQIDKGLNDRDKP